MSTEPQRYDLGYDVREGRDVIEQHDAGDYVLFSDYEAQQTMGGKLPYPMRFLIERSVKYPHAWEPGSPRWSAVGSVFQVGCNNAIAICKAFGFDPNEVREAYDPDEFGNSPIAL